MSDTSKFVDQAALWEGLERYSHLPDWLVAARDPEQIAQRLANSIPEFSSQKLRLLGCDIGHIRFKNNFWSGLYEVTFQQPDASSAEMVVLQGKIYAPGATPTGATQVEGEFAKAGWRAVFPDLNLELQMQEPETVLSALEFLTDPKQAAEFLETSIRAGSSSLREIKIAECKPRIVRYKPGSRCTIVYNLTYAPDANGGHPMPAKVVAKTYRGDKGQNAYDSMLALWRSPLGSGSIVTVAEPLSYTPENRVLLQGPIEEEQTLKELIISTIGGSDPAAMQELESCLRKTAAGLAALHNSNVRMGSTWTWENELNEVLDRIERLSVVLPELQPAAIPLLERLKTLDASTAPDTLVPTHGSFRPAQVLLHHGKIGFIDFDSFSQSEPGNDIALFLSTLMSLGLTTNDFDSVRDNGLVMDEATRASRFTTMSRLSNLFMEEYEKTMPLSRTRVALWETLDIFMLVLHGWIKIKVSELANIMYLLEEYLQAQNIVGAR